LDYTHWVVIPSVLFFWATESDRIPRKLYYSWPWEYEANKYGNANGNYARWAEPAADTYWSIIYLISISTPY
jgi:hypothetical protein